MTTSGHKQLSKLMSLILRHEPGKFGLTLDENGFVPFDALLTAVQSKSRWQSTSAAQIRQVVRESDKQRFEIVEDASGAKIRARYGHSVEGAVAYEPITPPDILFHGTSRRALETIKRDGLKPMKRQYVHLSIEPQRAQIVGARHDSQPVMLVIRAGEAARNGVQFYQGEARLFLADHIPSQFIDF